MNTNLFIARNLWKRGAPGEKGLSASSTIIAGFSVGVSVLVMVLAIAISDGFKFEIRTKATGFSGEVILNSPGIEQTSNRYPITKKLSYIKEIESLKEVKSLHGYAYRSGVLKSGDEIQGVVLKGVDSQYDWSFFSSVLSKGRLPNYQDSLVSKEIILSERLAGIMGFDVGEDLQIYFIDKSIRVGKYRLVGLYDAQLEDIDKTLLIADIREVQRLNGWRAEDVSGIEILLKAGEDINTVRDKIEKVVYERAGENDPSVAVTSINEIFPHLFDWLKLLDFNVLVVLVLMIAVAGFNMISSLLIILFERISMIGILKSLGMRNSAIHRIFLLRASYIIFQGMLFGDILAIVLALLQKSYEIISLDPTNYFVKSVPVYLNFPKIFLLNIAAFIIIIVVLMIPSLFISRISPDKTIRVK